MKILLDTNFLLLPNQFGIDIFGGLAGYELFTLSSCMDELRRIAKGRGRDAKAAKIGLKLVDMHKLKIEKTRLKGDEAIIQYANSEKCVVATNDTELIKKLKKMGIKIVRMRQKKYLDME